MIIHNKYLELVYSILMSLKYFPKYLILAVVNTEDI